MNAFTLPDLMEILTEKAGLPRDAVSTDGSATLTDIGLDSLAFLQVQAEIADRHGFELEDARPDDTFAQMVARINEKLSRREAV
ncbi:acyl carrier protein [Actinomadura sp. NTSP31]|uniref:acyl carrier protein n=1 Tax=Actinomadura sp. NTSP31 TaxID=1735447 RepID=UPI0035C0E7BC